MAEPFRNRQLRRFSMNVDLRLRHRWPRLFHSVCGAAVAIAAWLPVHRSQTQANDDAAEAANGIKVLAEPDPEIADPSWRLLHLIHPAHRQGIWHLAFSPDGKTIASAAGDNRARLWDVATGVLRTSIERPVKSNCAAFSPDGRKLVIAGGDSGEHPAGELVLWNLARGEVETSFLDHTTAKYVRWAAFSPDGKWIAAGGTDKTVTIWNSATGKLQRALRGHTSLVASVAFSPDGLLLASASFDRSIRIWVLETGETLGTLNGHEAEVRMVAFAPNGRLLLSTSDDKTARLWDAETFEQVTVMDGHEGFVLCGAFSPDGSKLVTAGKTSGGRRVLLRDVPSGHWGDMRLFPSQTSDIMSVAFSPDGDLLAIAGGFDSFQIWKRN
jgi:WD40 repeat protein